MALRHIFIILAAVNIEGVQDYKGGHKLGGLRPHAPIVVQDLLLALAHIEGPLRGVFNHCIPALHTYQHEHLVSDVC